MLTHKDFQDIPYMVFLRQAHQHYRGAALPDVTVGGDVAARVRQGRWVVLCPDTNCNSAVVADPATPLFMCVECGNTSIGGKWYGVKFPKNCRALEAILIPRPLKNRNWEPGESAAQLRRENMEHGV